MPWIRLMTVMTLVSAAMAVMAPAKADAFLRIGMEARWAPIGDETMTERGRTFTPQRQIQSTGIGLRGLIDVKFIAVGGKFNFTHHVFSDVDLNYTQFDANAHLRTGLPFSRLAFFVEGGPSVSLDIGSLGYNVGAGTEIDLLGLPLVDLNLGFVGQYAEVSVGAGPDATRLNEGIRGLITLGVDFAFFN